METSFLSFDFINKHGEKEPLRFSNPEFIICANEIFDVPQALTEVEQAVKEGFYAAGYLSYESAPAFDPAFKVSDKSKSDVPYLWFGIYRTPNNGELPEGDSFKVSNWESSTSYDNYQKAIERIKNEIEEGTTYQVNYTMRLHASFEGDSFSFYRQLSENQAANYCAYLDIGKYKILSASPELFFRLDQRKIQTKPMKGTIRRGRWSEEDIQLQDELFESEKNRAENLMIVDLLRNDLGRIANPGSVQVPKLFEVEKYPTVHQMTSTVEAEISDETSLLDIFSALFPCGSITGAPKISTMNIISSLEEEPRNIYCGAIGYISPNQEAVFNVPIRTVLINESQKEAVYGAGGGVTWDSDTQDEYDEAFVKAEVLTMQKPIFQLLETVKLDRGNYSLLDRHLSRMRSSSHYFDFKYDEQNIKLALNELKSNCDKSNSYKVRILLSKDGTVDIESYEITPENNDKPKIVALGKKAIDKQDPFLYHKTTHRKVYEDQAKQMNDDLYSVLLWNEEEELCEFTFGNLVVELDGERFTPYVESGLLRGTFREYLIEIGEITEKHLHIDDLKHASNIWLINSVREWVSVTLKGFET